MNERLRVILKKTSFLWHKAKSLVFPPTCAFCQAPIEEYHALCAQCWLSLKFINRNVCRICGEAITDKTSEKYNANTSTQCCAQCTGFVTNKRPTDVISFIVYDDFSKQFLLRFKEKNDTSLALVFAQFFNKQDFDDIDLIVPVPLHPLRLWQRTYNQSALLAMGLRHWAPDVPEIGFNSLCRMRYTPKQKKKGVEDRQKNIQKSMYVPYASRPKIFGKRIAVIDDVVASGATLAECKRALEAAGAREVCCFALAQS
ncbi:amidophosphoribosyltransferase [Alphaproteobacteria bacterium]|nr:amidophosphoribosyltransferase [Alphaproteobacteria bacterium]GHT00321.1 amidophosphoribosyltransferase [Alphaproteobacteria bacterium]